MKIFAAAVSFLFAAAGVATADEDDNAMTVTASGSFEVKLAPLDTHASADTLGRMSIDKVFTGDLEATSKGEMLTAMTGTEGSAVYVAIERVEGTLDGRQGSFVLHHRGVMHAGEQELEIFVVPESGTGELRGISGKMQIRIEEGKHFYEFEYRLP